MKKHTRIKNKPTTHLLYILDESGSMESIKSSVIDGFNEYMQGLKKKGGFKVTLTKFDSTGIRTPYVAKNIKEVPKLTVETYSPGSMTPLFDACVDAIEHLAKEVNDKQPVLVAIMTDGMENDSRHHTQTCLRDLITKLQAQGNWTFIFMGANQDSWETATQWGISRGNIANWQATGEGAHKIFRNLAQNTVMYDMSMTSNAQKGIAMNVQNFFTQEMKEKI